MGKILIVDDDFDLVDAMKIVLESDGHQVISALSGDEGLKIAREEVPDLIVVDLMMEYATEGFDVAKELRQDEVLCKTPILMLTAIKETTGISFKKDVDKEYALYVDEYLEKPLKPKELMAKVKAFLPKE